MIIHFDDDRASDSPCVERVWRCHSERGGVFQSVSAVNWEMVVSRVQGHTIVTVRGPETIPAQVPCPPEGEWLAIRFRVGTFMPQLPAHTLMNSLGVNLPQLSDRAFLLDGSKWEVPTYENAETFVSRLVRRGLVQRDAEVAAAAEGGPHALSTRSAQRRLLAVAGIPAGTLRQIRRARMAVSLLREAAPIADVVARCGYYDHPHLTRSLQRWIGLTPSAIATGATQLSFLYKTESSTVR